VVLPPKPVTAHIADPFAGSNFYFSGSANDLNNKMTKAFTLGAGATLDAKVNYGIEEGYDYANVIVSTDGGATWQTVPTNLSTSSVEPNGIDGFSYDWVDLHVDLSAFTGNVMLGFQYRSDGGVNFDGHGRRDSDQRLSADGAGGGRKLTFTASAITGTAKAVQPLHGRVPHVQPRPGSLPVHWRGPWSTDHFAYQDGMLLHYWDTSVADNNTGLHPGQGLLLPIDAHPQALKRCGTTTNWRNRIQTYDSTFTLDRTDGIPNIHHNSALCSVPSLPAVKMFDDHLVL
jgi:immune inhibitor A